MTWTSFRAVAFLIALLSSARAGAKDGDAPAVLTPVHSHHLEPCEGFFTLGRSSLLVIGSEERLDTLIDEGELPDQDAIDRWDQPRYETERRRAAEAFALKPVLDGTRDIPPGLKMLVRGKTVYTASPGEQPARLRDLLRVLMSARTPGVFVAVHGSGQVSTSAEDPRSRGRDLRETFWVRSADSVAPTDDDYAKLPGRLHATGILIVRAGDSYTLIIFR